MKNIFKGAIVCTLMFSTSFGIAFGSQYKAQKKTVNKGATSNNGGTTVTPYIDTPQQKLLDSLGSIQTFNVDASVSAKLQSGEYIALDFDGKGDASDVSDIKLEGDIDVNLSGNDINASIGYFDSTVFFDFNNNYFKLKTDNVFDFIEMLPSHGLNFEMPVELTNLDIYALQDYILSLKEPDREGEGYYFTFNASEPLGLDNDLLLYIKTDSEYNFTGLRTDTISYGDMLFKLDVNLDRVQDINLVSPMENIEIAHKYQDFAPALNIVNNILNLTSKRQNTIGLDLELSKFTKDENEVESKSNLLATSINLSYDIDEKAYSIFGDVTVDEQVNSFDAHLLEETLYAHYHDLKVSIDTESVSNLVQFTMNKIGNEKIKELLDKLMGTMDTAKLLEILGKLPNTIQEITLTSEELGVDIKPSEAGIDSVSPFTITLKFNNESLESLELNNIRINDYEGSATVTFKDYVRYNVEKEQYVALEHAIPLALAISELVDDTQFRVEFDGTISSTKEGVNDITLGGGLQFDIEDGFGYGKAEIVDRKNYSHRLVADMKDKNEILFTYNEQMKGKVKSQTFIDIFDVVKEVMDEPSEHFNELFGSLMDQASVMPIMEIINGDYQKIANLHIISNLQVKDGEISFTVSLALVGLEETSLDIKLTYDEHTIHSLEISNLNFDDLNVNLKVELKEFDPSKESERLNPNNDEFLDFSDIKVLLQLGLNSSKYNYWKFASKVDLGFTLITGKVYNIKEVPFTVEIRNDHGKVDVGVSFDDFPIVKVLGIAINPNKNYYSAENRSVYFVYSDGNFYIKRTESVKDKLIFGTRRNYTLLEKCDTGYFMDNILTILLEDVLSLGDLITGSVEKSENNKDENYQIPYEKILKNFKYDKDNQFFFISADVGALANSKELKDVDLWIYDDLSTNELTGLKANLDIKVGITIKIALDLTLADHQKEATEDNKIAIVDTLINDTASLAMNTKSEKLS